jgi:hypothetical protein
MLSNELISRNRNHATFATFIIFAGNTTQYAIRTPVFTKPTLLTTTTFNDHSLHDCTYH